MSNNQKVSNKFNYDLDILNEDSHTNIKRQHDEIIKTFKKSIKKKRKELERQFGIVNTTVYIGYQDVFVRCRTINRSEKDEAYMILTDLLSYGLIPERLSNYFESTKTIMYDDFVEFKYPLKKDKRLGLDNANIVKSLYNTLLDYSVSAVAGVDKHLHPIEIDFKKQPNVIINSTDYEGNEDMMKTMVASMMANYTPDEVDITILDAISSQFDYIMPETNKYYRMKKGDYETISEMNRITSESLSRIDLLMHEGYNNIEQYNEIARCEGKKTLPHQVVIINELLDIFNLRMNIKEFLLSNMVSSETTGIHFVIFTESMNMCLDIDKRFHENAFIITGLCEEDDDKSRTEPLIKDKIKDLRLGEFIYTNGVKGEPLRLSREQMDEMVKQVER